MQRAQVLTLLVRLFVIAFVSAPLQAAAAVSVTESLLVFSHDLIRQKQQVPDDPLAGLPTDDGSHREQGKGGSGASGRVCAIKANAANDRDIGDLRATLAFVKHGPSSLPCPARSAQSDMRLRVSIDGNGKITAAESIAGDNRVANAVAKKLAGKSIGPRAEGATVGIVVVTFASRKP